MLSLPKHDRRCSFIPTSKATWLFITRKIGRKKTRPAAQLRGRASFFGRVTTASLADYRHEGPQAVELRHNLRFFGEGVALD